MQHDPELVAQFHAQITEIRHWFRHSNLYRWKFISSSLFLVHGDQPCTTALEASLSSSSSQKAIIKMIDFAHVFPNPKPENDDDNVRQDLVDVGAMDQNYLYGLDKLDYYFTLAANQLKP